MKGYDHTRIEKKWQKVWKETGLYKTTRPKKIPRLADSPLPLGKGESDKSYVLDMFPYPSGDGLHVGHPKGYIATDVFSRLKRMQGYAILHPMGWDALGLPAENYAIANKVHPAIAVKKNIKRFKKQLEVLGFNYDWDREINTTDPTYYKWTQWIFLQMFKKGLAFESHEPINWCPSCKTGLANEDLETRSTSSGQVAVCERCGSVIEKKAIPQWVLRITDYADRLLSDLDGLNWPEYIKESQRNWIGRSEGLLFTAPVKDTSLTIQTFSAHFEAFYADTFVVIAPDHPRLNELISGTATEKEVRAFADELVRKRLTLGRENVGEPEGICTGRYIVDPIGNGDLPIWVANFAIADYGTGIVKASAHDERDFAFAKKYNIPLKPVIFPTDPELRARVERQEVCFFDMKEGILTEPAEFAGMRGGECRHDIADFAVKKGFAVKKTSYKLRDWVFSRQRYWGEPIPLIHCPKCGVVPVPEKELPVKLPTVKSYEPTGTGESPLAKIEKWVNVKCPKCKGPAKRETNTMPQWAGSCWYYLAYIVKRKTQIAGQSKKLDPTRYTLHATRALTRWLPVDMYVGGAEHATRHLIYARFWHKFLYDIGVVSTSEPFERLQNVGLIQASDGRKMSKRFGNVINPDDIVATYGADSLRVYEMFMGPFNQAIAWNSDSLVGARRFLERAQKLRLKIEEVRLKKDNDLSKDLSKSANVHLISVLHQTIKKVGEDIEAFRFNTAISSLMILLNALEKESEVPREAFEIFLKLLCPFAPHLAEELWSSLNNKHSIHTESWPVFDNQVLLRSDVTIVVQVNGKVRGHLTCERGTPKEALTKLAYSLADVAKWTDGKEVKKVVTVPDRIINIVVG